MTLIKKEEAEDFGEAFGISSKRQSEIDKELFGQIYSGATGIKSKEIDSVVTALKIKDPGELVYVGYQFGEILNLLQN